jgi:hypothetical protein
LKKWRRLVKTIFLQYAGAQSVHVCEPFYRAFKSVFGSAPGEFVETLRINEAKRRLSVPKRTLETIAASVGFADAQTFRRAFERRLGAKPRSYLKNLNGSSIAAASTNGEAALSQTGRMSGAQKALSPSEIKNNTIVARNVGSMSYQGL